MEGMILGVSGARGVAGLALVPEVACRLSAAFGLTRGGRILVARDSRPSGVCLVQAVCAGLHSVGVKPVLAGIATTPGAQVAVEELGLDGGVVVTASHNPPEWNGLKFIGADGAFLTLEEVTRIYERAREAPARSTPWERVATQLDLVPLHVRRILASPLVDPSAIRKRGFRVVADANHGAAGPLLRTLASVLDIRMRIIGEEPTGEFAHPPEPRPPHLTSLVRAVEEEQADLGIALDPDGDRAVFSVRGAVLPEEATLPLVALATLKPGDLVVTNLSTSRMVEDVAQRKGARVIRTPVGEAHVVRAMRETRAALGGEGNGGVIVPSVHRGRDAAVALVVTLTHLAREGAQLHDLWGQLPRYAMLKLTAKVSAWDGEAVAAALGRALGPAQQDTRDGVHLSTPSWWVHVRPSNTEPVVRVIVEAEDQEAAHALAGRVMETISRGMEPCVAS